MSNDSGRSIFVLAGMPASGSTGLLQQLDRRNLFGGYSEQVRALSRISSKGFHAFTNFQAQAQNDPNFSWPEQAVLHVEITAACSFKRKPYQSFQDEDFILKEFRSNLSDIFSHYSNKVVNTVELDLSVLAQQYFAHKHEPSNVSSLYKNRDQETLKCIFSAWNRYLAEINCWSLRTKWDNRNQDYYVIEPTERMPTPATMPKTATATFTQQWRTGVKPGL